MHSDNKNVTRNSKQKIKTVEVNLSTIQILELAGKDYKITVIRGCARKNPPPHIVGGTVNLCSHYEKQYGGSSENEKQN